MAEPLRFVFAADDDDALQVFSHIVAALNRTGLEAKAHWPGDGTTTLELPQENAEVERLKADNHALQCLLADASGDDGYRLGHTRALDEVRRLLARQLDPVAMQALQRLYHANRPPEMPPHELVDEVERLKARVAELEEELKEVRAHAEDYEGRLAEVRGVRESLKGLQ